MKFQQVIVTQFILDALGLYKGEIDGVFGPKTKAAWETFNSGKYLKEEEERIVNVLKNVDERISHASFCLIAYFEGGGKSYYYKRLANPSVPSQTSGITIGLGFDIYYQREDLARYWSGILSDDEINRLRSVSGYLGEHARKKLPLVRSIYVDYFSALSVLSKNLVYYTDLAINAFKTAGKGLNRDQIGVLTSIVYNRGASMAGERRREMREIRDHIQRGKLDAVPAAIRSMKRLWSDEGLIKRREMEAKLWEHSIS